MKTTALVTVAGLIFSTQALLATVARPSHALKAPAPIVDALTEAFPDFVERIGGFSMEFNIDELLCSRHSALGAKASGHDTVTVCIAGTQGLVRKIEGPRADALFDALLVGGVERRDKISSTHLLVEKLSCSVVEPKPQDPSNVVAAVYSCAIGN